MNALQEDQSFGSSSWIEGLREGSLRREIHVGELRNFLKASLRAALSGNSAADDGFLEDMAQDGTLKILRNLGSFEGSSRFSTWATTIVVRLAYAELRKTRWKDVSLEQILEQGRMDSSESHESHFGGAGGGSSPDQESHRTSVFRILQSAIEEDLNERQRTAMLAELGGMNQAPLALKLGLSTNALYKLVHDARKKLRVSLEKKGISIEDVRSLLSDASNPQQP
jgi:RNA polymerase sigma-70 factor, ECF subfamily